MAARININADLGEGHGAYDIGDDLALLDIVKTANIACGMHGGDATVMRRVVGEAARRGVSIGAHPGFNDLWGFGRRQIRMNAADLEYLVAYQIGAMRAMAAYEGQPVTHVKIHGAMNNMACVDRGYADAVARAVKTVAPDLIHLVIPRTEMERATLAAGLPMAREGFVDRAYEASGLLASRAVEGAVIRDPNTAAERALMLATEGVVIARTGEPVAIEVDSLCVHGDEPSAVAVARAAREALEMAGVEIVPLPEMSR